MGVVLGQQCCIEVKLGVWGNEMGILRRTERSSIVIIVIETFFNDKNWS